VTELAAYSMRSLADLNLTTLLKMNKTQKSALQSLATGTVLLDSCSF